MKPNFASKILRLMVHPGWRDLGFGFETILGWADRNCFMKEEAGMMESRETDNICSSSRVCCRKPARSFFETLIIFKSSFKFTAKLRGKYSDVPYTCCLCIQQHHLMFWGEWPFPSGSHQFLVPQGEWASLSLRAGCAKGKLQRCHPILMPPPF